MFEGWKKEKGFSYPDRICYPGPDYRVRIFFGAMSVVALLDVIGGIYLAHSNLKNSKFKFNELDDGSLQVYAEVKYDSAKKWFLVERVNELGENELCVTNKKGMNVLTKEFVGELVVTDDLVVSADESILSVSRIEPYLESYYPKDLYAPEDIQKLLDLIALDYEWHAEKVFTVSKENPVPLSLKLEDWQWTNM